MTVASFHDRQRRLIDIRRYGDGPETDEFEALVSFYRSFDPSLRENDIPPGTEPTIRTWLDQLVAGHSVVAWHGTNAVGQVVLVPDPKRGHELAIFVHQHYRRSGVGARLVAAVLAIAADERIERMGLLTTKDDRAMLGLAHRSGFVETSSYSGQVELAFRPTTPE